MAVTLSALIDDVQQQAPSAQPLDLLATASARVEEIDDMTDALLAHFIDRCRRAGHSWAEIGSALGVSKQAVQKRFAKEERRSPAGWDQWTPRAKRVVQELAPAAAEELGHRDYIGTEHLLIALIDSGGVAAVAMRDLGVERAAAVDGVRSRVPPGTGRGGFTPRAWVAMTNCIQQALKLGHNYVGTEHLLLALLDGVGGVAADVLADLGVDHSTASQKVVALLEAHQPK